MRSQSNFVNVLRQKDSLTENLAVTNSTSLSGCVDMFFMAGAARKLNRNQIISMFESAFAEDPVTAMKILFWARDIRGGAGERRFFRLLWEYIAFNYPKYVAKTIHLIREYGRWDDLWKDETGKKIRPFKDGIDERNTMTEIQAGLEDKSTRGLIAKWLPRKGPFASDVAAFLGLSPKEYRKMLVNYSNTVEQQMCARQWENITYESVPSVAMKNYRKAFFRHDESRFQMYINSVLEGKTTMKAGAIFPHDIVSGLMTEYHRDEALIAQWNSLPDYLEGNASPFLPVVDTSGSMFPNAIVVALALGLYMSERNKSVFKNAFITFSESPQMQYVTGDIYQRIHQMQRAHWGMNTNLELVYRLILRRAVEGNLQPEDMPSAIIILSDMEFDRCVCNSSHTLLENMTLSFKQAGYRRPDVVFWNIEGRSMNNKPATVNDAGVALVSGFSPALLKSLLAGKIENPLQVMQRIINQERYSAIEKALSD